MEKAFRFDPKPFPILSTVVSLEAIFLATFILISQNRQQRVADLRNHLDLQINMLAEQENSQMLAMLQKLLELHGIEPPSPEIEVLQQAMDPEVLAEHIEQAFEPADESL